MDPVARITPILRTDEQLLWCGVPDPAVWFTPADAFLIPFSLMWGGFAIFWETGVMRSGGPVFFEFWGVPFVMIGLYFIIGRFIYKRARKRRTVYGITTARAIVLVGAGSVSDTPMRDQPVTVRRSRGGRHASVTIGHPMPSRRRYGGSAYGWPNYANTGMDFFTRGAVSPVAFYDVADPDAMLRALDQARGSSPVV